MKTKFKVIILTVFLFLFLTNNVYMEDYIVDDIDILNTESERYVGYIARPLGDVDYSPNFRDVNFENNPAVEVKGLYVTSSTAGLDRMDDIIQMIKETELNSVVIDVKNDSGYILFHSKTAEELLPVANKYNTIKDMETFMKKLKDNNIYTIARIVAFKSPLYAKAFPEKAICYKNSTQLLHKDGAYWASPYDKQLWEYNVGIAKEAIDYGFNEIQFDYVRFPDLSKSHRAKLDFRNEFNQSMTRAIQDFTKYAYSEINKKQAFVSLDVFGWTATTLDDSGIGQHWEGMSNVCDYMCPMVYPSHYGKNIFGFAVPDAHPYGTIYNAMKDCQERNLNIYTPAKLRPWLQAFTATWVKGHISYRKQEIKEQIRACNELGINEYIFWNAGNNYPRNWFETNKE